MPINNILLKKNKCEINVSAIYFAVAILLGSFVIISQLIDVSTQRHNLWLIHLLWSASIWRKNFWFQRFVCAHVLSSHSCGTLVLGQTQMDKSHLLTAMVTAKLSWFESEHWLLNNVNTPAANIAVEVTEFGSKLWSKWNASSLLTSNYADRSWKRKYKFRMQQLLGKPNTSPLQYAAGIHWGKKFIEKKKNKK